MWNFSLSQDCWLLSNGHLPSRIADSWSSRSGPQFPDWRVPMAQSCHGLGKVWWACNLPGSSRRTDVWSGGLELKSSAFEVRLRGGHTHEVGLPRRQALLLPRAVHDNATRGDSAQPLIIGAPVVQASCRNPASEHAVAPASEEGSSILQALP